MTTDGHLDEYYRQAELWEMSRFEGNPDQRLRASVIASLVDTDVKSILDVGCGNGFITRQLRAARVVGLDPSEEALAHFDGESVIGSADSLPFDDLSFDAIVCVSVLEHLSPETFVKAVAELARVPRRFLVIGVPYRQDLREGTTLCPNCHRRYHVDLHQRTFRGPKDLSALLPDFALRAAVFLGAHWRVRSRIFRTFHYMMLGPLGRSEFAICPHCGSRNAGDPRNGRRLRKWLFDGLAWRMKKSVLPYWLIVLLERRKAPDED